MESIDLTSIVLKEDHNFFCTPLVGDVNYNCTLSSEMVKKLLTTVTRLIKLYRQFKSNTHTLTHTYTHTHTHTHTHKHTYTHREREQHTILDRIAFGCG